MSHRFLRCGFALVCVAFLSACGASSTFVVKGGVSAAAAARSLLLGENLGLRAMTAGSPTAFNLKLYAAYLTTNADCSGPFVEVANNGTAGSTFDMVAAPTIISASPAAGNYSCFILRMSDVMTFRPDATAAAAFPAVCSTSTDATFDIYRAGETPEWKDKDGNDITASGDAPTPTESSYTVSGATVTGVTVYATTNKAAAVATGKSTNQVLDLAAVVGVTDATTNLTLITDFRDKVSDHSGTHCWMEGGTLAIQ